MKKLILIQIALIVISAGFLSGCTTSNINNGSVDTTPQISYFTTSDSDLNDFDTHIENDTFAQMDTVYVYCEFCNMVHNGGYDLSIDYRVEKAGIKYDEAHRDFTGTATGSTQSHSWEFTTDKTWSIGNYAVYIDIVDKIAQETYSEVAFINILNRPTAYAEADDTQGKAPFTVSFTGSGADTDGTIESYYWDFKDGEASSEQNPTHTFNSEGTYTVTLKVTDNDGIIGEDEVMITVFGNTFTLNPTDDVSVGQMSTGSAYSISGDSPGMAVSYDEAWYEWEEDGFQIIYLKFDLSDIPSDSIVDSARLRLSCYVNSLPVDVQVHQHSDITWSEQSIPVQWCFSHPYSSSSSDTVTVDKPLFTDEWYEWNVKDYVQNSLSIGKITLVLDTYSDSRSAYFNSKDKLENIPELVVEIL